MESVLRLMLRTSADIILIISSIGSRAGISFLVKFNLIGSKHCYVFGIISY